MTQSKKGYISKIETMGMVDGPGVRTIVFLSGCPLRCLYCHNPDFWQLKVNSEEMDVETLVNRLKRLKPYYGDKGGVTACGGEPLFQSPFLIELFKRCKEEGINTCLDTSGFGNPKYFDEVLTYTDTILYDIKAIEKDKYQKLTSVDMSITEKFLKKAIEMKVPIWSRTVIIPGYNDTYEHMDNLAEYISSIPTIEKIDLLPYHTLGVNKYKEINMQYPLEGVPSMDAQKAREMNEYLNKRVQEIKSIKI